MAATVNWFYMKGEEKVGPVSQDVLCDMFRGGMLSLQTLVRSDAFTKWTPASSIAALRSLCSAQFPAPSLASPTVPNGGRPVLDYDSTDSAGPIGIGGWLILPAIGLIAGPILGLFSTLGLWWIGNQIANKGIGGSTGSIRIVAAASTLFTLFQTMTGEAWPDVARDVMDRSPSAWIYFVVYILISSFMVLNLFIAVVVSAMEGQVAEEVREAEAEHAAEDLLTDQQILVELREIRAELAALSGQRSEPSGAAANAAAPRAD